MLVPGTLAVGNGKFLINKNTFVDVSLGYLHTIIVIEKQMPNRKRRLSLFSRLNDGEDWTIVLIRENCINDYFISHDYLKPSIIEKKNEMFAVFDLLASNAHYSAEFHFTT